MISEEDFDKAIVEWATTGSLSDKVKSDLDSVFKLIDSIPQFVHPLTKDRFYNVAEQFIGLVYNKPEFVEVLVARVSSPDEVTRKAAIWLCCLLVPTNPELALELQQNKGIATVECKKNSEPRLFEVVDFKCIRKQAILIYAHGWPEYIALLKSAHKDIARYTAAALWSETRDKQEKVDIQIKIGLHEYAYRIFDKSTSYLPFLASWLGVLNNRANKSLLSWEKIKSILRKAPSGFNSPDIHIVNSTFDSMWFLVGDNPWTHKKNICDKMVDLGYHHKIIPYLKDPKYQSKAVQLVALMSNTRPEELLYSGTMDFLIPLMSSKDETIRQLAAKAERNIVAVE